ncbi:endolytic transglycosylase MltG [Sulfurovum sp.]|uniref:endolytic transglycosylase MltG n=1 Tax=Sulfurovum sp. TaxID=1969726 RepID=UPI0025F6BD4A|nr:endolytic transglycosylase MltG [Sulfurovum sp.]
MKELFTQEYKRIVRYIEILIVIVVIAAIYNFISPASEHKTFYLSGSSSKEIAHELEKYGYTVTFIDQIFMHLGTLPKEGWYHVKDTKKSRYDFFSSLHEKNADVMQVVVYAGETAKELCHRLANDMKLDEKNLFEEYETRSRFKEADIFAQSYSIARNADAFAAMQYLFDLSNNELAAFEKEYFTQKPKLSTMRILLTIASIIQKESNSVKEMPLISSVIYNRLDKKMKLQMDCTLNYGKYSHVIVTPERIRTDHTYFNTYRHKGLPPQPLGTVTIDALRAAMMPSESKYLFFMLTPGGSHNFAVTYEEHLKNIRAFREYLRKKKALKERKTNQTVCVETNATKP